MFLGPLGIMKEQQQQKQLLEETVRYYIILHTVLCLESMFTTDPLITDAIVGIMSKYIFTS